LTSGAGNQAWSQCNSSGDASRGAPAGRRAPHADDRATIAIGTPACRRGVQPTSLESAVRSFKRRSTDISNAPDVGSIKQGDLASIRSPAPPERRFSDAMNAILRFRHPPKIRSPATPGLCWLFFQWPGLGFLGFAPPRPAQLHLTPSLAAAINFAHTDRQPADACCRQTAKRPFCAAAGAPTTTHPAHAKAARSAP